MGKFGQNHENATSLEKFLLHPVSHWMHGENEVEGGEIPPYREWGRHFLSVFRRFTGPHTNQPFPQTGRRVDLLSHADR